MRRTSLVVLDVADEATVSSVLSDGGGTAMQELAAYRTVETLRTGSEELVEAIAAFRTKFGNATASTNGGMCEQAQAEVSAAQQLGGQVADLVAKWRACVGSLAEEAAAVNQQVRTGNLELT